MVPMSTPVKRLLDLYTIRSELAGRERGSGWSQNCDGGRPPIWQNGSLACKLLSLFDHLRISLVSPEALANARRRSGDLRRAGHDVLETEVLEIGHYAMSTLSTARVFKRSALALGRRQISTVAVSDSIKAFTPPTASPIR